MFQSLKKDFALDFKLSYIFIHIDNFAASIHNANKNETLEINMNNKHEL